jgi:hypothetical protein
VSCPELAEGPNRTVLAGWVGVPEREIDEWVAALYGVEGNVAFFS